MAEAPCPHFTSSDRTFEIKLPANITIQQDAPRFTLLSNWIGSDLGGLGTVTLNIGSGYAAACGIKSDSPSKNIPTEAWNGFENVKLAKANETVTIDGISYTIYKTTNPGVGIVFSSMSRRDSNDGVRPHNLITSPWWKDYGLRAFWSDDLQFGIKARLVLLNGRDPEINKKIAINEAPIGSLNFSWKDKNAGETNNHTIYVTGSSIVKPVSCALMNARQTVNLGTVQKRDLDKNGVSEKKQFTIGIQCMAGTHPHITFNGQNGNHDVIDGTFLLANPTDKETAKGVVIQLLHKDGQSPVILNNEQDWGKVNKDKTEIKVDYYARYKRIGDISPGKANGLLDFTFTYH